MVEDIYKQYKSFGMIEETGYGLRNSWSPSWTVAADDAIKEESGIENEEERRGKKMLDFSSRSWYEYCRVMTIYMLTKEMRSDGAEQVRKVGQSTRVGNVDESKVGVIVSLVYMQYGNGVVPDVEK